MVAASDKRLMLVREFEQPAVLSVHHLLAELYQGVDWVLVEGWKHADLPKIEITHPGPPENGDTFLAYRREARRSGWVRAAVDPAVIGVLTALGICFWSAITVDLTPRLFWIGTPFAATLVARWFSDGRPRDWLNQLTVPGLPADSG